MELWVPLLKYIHLHIMKPSTVIGKHMQIYNHWHLTELYNVNFMLKIINVTKIETLFALR